MQAIQTELRRCAVGLALLFTVAGRSVQSGEFELHWFTVDGGGATATTDGMFTLGSTIGQPDAHAPITDGEFVLIGGFWAGVQRAPRVMVGDMNCDGVISVSDISGFVLAVTAPAQYSTAYPDCNILNGDIDGDEMVTVDDIGGFVALVVGAG